MPDFLERLRMSNIYNPQAMNQGTMFQPTVQPFNNIDFGASEFNPNPSIDPSMADRMNQLYTPETQAGDRLNGMIDNYPERSTDQGWLRKIAAIGLSTLSDMYGAKKGPETYENVMNPGYDKKIEKFKNTIGPAQNAASLERQNNVNERTMAYQTVANQLKQSALDAKEKNDTINQQIREQRAAVYEFKAKNPNLKIVTTKGGNVIAMNPQTGATIDTGIPTGSLSEADKLNLTQEDMLERIHERGDESRETVKVRGAESRLTKSTPSGTISSKPTKTELPTQTRTRQVNNARQLANSDPTLAPFIQFDGNNVTIVPPSEGWLGHKGPTKKQFDKIKAAVYGTDIPINQPTRTGSDNTSNPTKTPNAANPIATKTSGIDKRSQATEILRKNGKPVTEKNIAFVMKQLGQ